MVINTHGILDFVIDILERPTPAQAWLRSLHVPDADPVEEEPVEGEEHGEWCDAPWCELCGDEDRIRQAVRLAQREAEEGYDESVA